MAELVTSPIVELPGRAVADGAARASRAIRRSPVTAHPDWWVCPPCHDALYGPERQPC